jgi:arabinosaccharide transport system permease protein
MNMNTKKARIKTILLILFFVIIALITLLPLALLAVSSLRSGSDLMRYGLNFSIDWSTANLNEYKLLFSGENAYFTWYKNSLVITVVQTVLALFLSACVGYGFAMYDFKGKNIAFMAVLLVMMVPTEVILLPLYRLIIKMGLINSMWGIILPYLVIPMLVFFFRQYLSGISKEFLDAARVDGCSEYGIFIRIMVPLMKPSFAAMGIYEGMASWNNFLWPMIVTNEMSKITLPVGLQSLLSPYGNNYDILIAGSCFAIVPILVLFVCFQQYFIEGMTAGGVKG